MVRISRREKIGPVKVKLPGSFYFKQGASFADRGDYPKAIAAFDRSGFHEDGAKVILQDYQVDHAYDLLRRKLSHKDAILKLESLIELVHTGQSDTIASLKSTLKEVMRLRGPLVVQRIIRKSADYK